MVLKIYNLGSLNMDYVYSVPHFVRPGETISAARMEVYPGGKGLNQSVALARAGARVIHGGLTGGDAALLTDTLRAAGVDISRLKQTAHPSGHALIQVDEQGQNCIIVFHGANYAFDRAYILSVLADAEAGDILLLQNEINALPEIFEIAHAKGLRIALNPSPYDRALESLPLAYVSLWLCNEIEGGALTGETEPQAILRAMSAKFPQSDVLLTLGGDGAMFQRGDVVLRQPAYPCAVVDTTAAGDTFTGFFIASLADGKPAETALKMAAAAASLAVSRPGASASIPRMDEIVL